MYTYSNIFAHIMPGHGIPQWRQVCLEIRCLGLIRTFVQPLIAILSSPYQLLTFLFFISFFLCLTCPLFFYYYLLILRDRETERQRETVICYSTYFMLSLVDSYICPDQGSNLQPWHMGTML